MYGAVPRQVLNCARCSIADPSPLGVLYCLSKLDISDNPILRFEPVIEMLEGLDNLHELDMRDCPLAKRPKYRDHMTLMTTSQLSLLDDKPITTRERQFLVQLHSQKAKRRAALEAKSEKQELEQKNHGDRVKAHEAQIGCRRCSARQNASQPGNPPRAARTQQRARSASSARIARTSAAQPSG